MRKLIPILAVLYSIIVCNAFSQISISGTVLSLEDSTSIVDANISSYNNGTLLTNTQSDKTGKFLISVPSDKIISLHISHIGFKPYYIEIKNNSQSIDLGNIMIETESHAIEEVVVVGQNKKVDKSIHIPSVEDKKKSYGILTLLENMNLTGLTVDKLNEKASVNGGKVFWQINGIPKTINDIKSLDYKDIIRVEYSDNPSIRYQDKGFSGIINIIVKKHNNGGTAQLSAQSAVTTGFVNANASASYHRDNHEVSVYYNNSYRDYRKWEKDETVEYLWSNGNKSELNIDGQPSKFGYIDNSLNLSYLYQPDERNNYSIAFTYNWANNWNDINSKVHESGLADYDRLSKHRYHSNIPQLDLYSGNKIGDNGKLEVNIHGTFFKNNNIYELKNNTSDIFYVRNEVDNERLSGIGEISYTHNFSNLFNLNAGVQTLFGRSKNTYKSDDTLLDIQNENNTYVFFALSGAKGKFSYSLGSGLKSFYVNNNYDKKYSLANRSTLSLMYVPVNSFSIRYIVNYNPTIPSLSDLSVAEQTKDNFSTIKGNPSLNIEKNFTHQLIFHYGKGKISSNLVLFQQYSKDPIFTTIREDLSKNRFVFQPINGISYNRKAVQWDAKVSGIGKFLDFGGTVGFSDYKSNFDDNEKYKANNFYWRLNATLYYKDFTLLGNYSKPAKSLYGNELSTDENNVAMTLVWKRNNFTVFGSCYFMFQKYGSEYNSSIISQNYKNNSFVSILDNKNMITLGFIWNFNYGKSFNKQDRTLYNNDGRNSIVKVSE